MDSGCSAPSKHQAIPAAFPPNTEAELPTDEARVSRYKVGKDTHHLALSQNNTSFNLQTWSTEMGLGKTLARGQAS